MASKTGIGHYVVALGLLVGGAVYLAPSCEQAQQAAQTSQREGAAKIRAALRYLDEVPEVKWVEVEGNNVYIGFDPKPSDLALILRGAALKANAATDFGAHAWAVDAGQTGWRPGDGPYYAHATARYGRVQP